MTTTVTTLAPALFVAPLATAQVSESELQSWFTDHYASLVFLLSFFFFSFFFFSFGASPFPSASSMAWYFCLIWLMTNCLSILFNHSLGEADRAG